MPLRRDQVEVGGRYFWQPDPDDSGLWPDVEVVQVIKPPLSASRARAVGSGSDAVMPEPSEYDWWVTIRRDKDGSQLLTKVGRLRPIEGGPEPAEMTVAYKDKELLESKCFLTLGLGETVVALGQGKEALVVVLEFVDKPGDETKLEFGIIDESTLRVRCTNWSSALGTIFAEPAQVGIYKGRKMYLLLYVKKAGKPGQFRQVTLSVYLGEEVTSGQG